MQCTTCIDDMVLKNFTPADVVSLLLSFVLVLVLVCGGTRGRPDPSWKASGAGRGR